MGIFPRNCGRGTRNERGKNGFLVGSRARPAKYLPKDAKAGFRVEPGHLFCPVRCCFYGQSPPNQIHFGTRVLNPLEKLFQKKTSADPGWGLSHCFACSQRIRKGMLFPEDQVAFCERCFHSTPCWCCHLPCGPLHRRLSDERIVC